MKWNDLNRSQQKTAREASAKLFDLGVTGCTTSQCGVHIDEVTDWSEDLIGLDDLLEATGWTVQQTEPVEAETIEVEEEDAEEEEAPVDALDALVLAVATRVSADGAVTTAMLAASKAGHSANEIARRVAPVHSRPTTLAMLNAVTLQTQVSTALLDKGWTAADFCLGYGPGRMLLAGLADADGSTASLSDASALLNALIGSGFRYAVHAGDAAEPMEHVAAGGKVAVYGAED